MCVLIFTVFPFFPFFKIENFSHHETHHPAPDRPTHRPTQPPNPTTEHNTQQPTQHPTRHPNTRPITPPEGGGGGEATTQGGRGREEERIHFNVFSVHSKKGTAAPSNEGRGRKDHPKRSRRRRREAPPPKKEERDSFLVVLRSFSSLRWVCFFPVSFGVVLILLFFPVGWCRSFLFEHNNKKNRELAEYGSVSGGSSSSLSVVRLSSASFRVELFVVL